VKDESGDLLAGSTVFSIDGRITSARY